MTDSEGEKFLVVPLTVDSGAAEVGGREGLVIVKVQTALNGPGPALIYDRGRTFHQQVDAQQVEGPMKGRLKAYFYARLGESGCQLEDEAPAQGW